MALAQHIRLRRRDSGIIAPTTREQRIVARAVLERGERFGLLAFSAADTHLHMKSACSQDDAQEYARHVEISITKQLGGVGFKKAKVDPVEDQWHLHNLCDYVLRQDRRHGIEDLDPLRDCSNLPDLLGARLLGAYTLRNLKRALPRWRRGDFLRLVGAPDLEPAGDPLELLLDAAAAAVGRPALNARTAEGIAALSAAVKVAGDRLPCTELARLLGINRRTVHRLRQREADHELVQAVLLQLGLRRAKRALLAHHCNPQSAAGAPSRGGERVISLNSTTTALVHGLQSKVPR